MSSRIQDGIYYDKKQTPGPSLSIVFLRASQSSNAAGIGTILSKLWSVLNDLKNGIIKDLPQNSRNRLPGDLSFLLGYGPAAFELDGIKLPKPHDLNDERRFISPRANGGGPIIDGVGLEYSTDVSENPISDDHVIIQFIGDSEFTTQRAVVEIWKFLRDNNDGKNDLSIRTFYTGFNRADNRSWLGFHDGISNMVTSDRIYRQREN